MRAQMIATALFVSASGFVGCDNPTLPVALPQSPEVQAPEALSPETLPPPSSASSRPISVSPPPPLTVTTSTSMEPAGTIRISDVRSVFLEVDVGGAAAQSELALELLTPRGSSYHREVKTLTASAYDTQHVTFDVPVAGTMIDTSRLHGEWTARVFVNGAVVATQTFELTP